MKILFDEKVKVKLVGLGAERLALDYNYSLSPEVEAVSCDMIMRIRLAAVDSLPADFDAELDSELGPIAYKSYGARYLEDGMRARQTANGLIELASDSGLIGANVDIIDLRAH